MVNTQVLDLQPDARAVATFGKHSVIGIVSIAGWCSSFALVGNAFERAVLDADTPTLSNWPACWHPIS